MRIRWSGAALRDLQALQDYLVLRDPEAARHLVSVLRAAAQSLDELPYRGRPGRWPGTRELVVRGTPYIMPYRVQGQTVMILRAFHGARRWPDPIT